MVLAAIFAKLCQSFRRGWLPVSEIVWLSRTTVNWFLRCSIYAWQQKKLHRLSPFCMTSLWVPWINFFLSPEWKCKCYYPEQTSMLNFIAADYPNISIMFEVQIHFLCKLHLWWHEELTQFCAILNLLISTEMVSNIQLVEVKSTSLSFTVFTLLNCSWKCDFSLDLPEYVI